ncbi:hypothetical protein [Xenorhabdus sp. PB30.3]|uniref:hypothetical protein n=1 Tax=Xenorhabdus sp. PB30.3 TaxID=2788941 RepID=UPI001E553041|nr:hypothetical protein [Xenorhabdus sp. PB30.3]MCC8381938.1 hypothetical protein [Xenorhabdus sp. PB30.3]
MHIEYKEYSKKFNEISSLEEYSLNKLKSIREDLEKVLNNCDFKDNICVITTGSFGRVEASCESDMDFFIICDTEENKKLILEKKLEIDNVIKKHVPKNTGSTGTFGNDAINNIDEITSNIGGQKDSNELLTRRMLFLLEGAYLFNEIKFKKYRDLLISKYLEPTSGHYLDRYLINDIIRYYRTITTDFQFKVDENDKAWGLRNIKLKFSRKILYYSGIISVIHAFIEYSNSSQTKKEILLDVLDKPVMERTYNILQKYNELSILDYDINKIFEFYNLFLEEISKKENRDTLEKITKDNRKNYDIYVKLNDKSIFFTEKLYSLTAHIAKKQNNILEALIF